MTETTLKPWTVVLADSVLEAEAPARVRVTPWGQVQSTRGDFVVDDDAARAVQEAFAAHGTDLPIDFEHQTLGGAFASPRGTAPAAGWITALEAVPGEGLFASVTWTDEARQMLAARQYRYLSPVAIIHRADRRLVALHSAALTNKPAIVGMEPLVNSASAGIPNAETEIAALSASLALPADAPLVEILAAARARLGAVADENRQRAADERVAIVAAAGKLCEAQRPWALRLALEQPDLFDAWAATAPVLVPLGRTAPPATPSADASRAARAKAEYRGSTLLQSLTSEDAYVAQAARESAR